MISQISQIVAEGLRDASLIAESAKLEYKRGTPLMESACLRLRVMDTIVIGGRLAATLIAIFQATRPT